MRHKNDLTDSLLESRPFSVIVWDWECHQSEDKLGELYGPFGQWCPGKYHHAKVCTWTFTGNGPNYWPYGFQSHMCRAGQCLYKTAGLYSDPGSGRWSLGLWWGSDSPSNPRLSKFAARVPIILGMPTIGQVVNVMREVEMDALAMPWANARAAHLLGVWRMMTIGRGNGLEEKFDANDHDSLMYTQESGNHRALLLPYSTCEDREGLCRRTY